MRKDIQKHFEKCEFEQREECREHAISPEFIVKNEEVKIFGKGILQEILDKYKKE